MPKRKPKRKKKTFTRRVPPLSKSDRWIYAVLGILSAMIALGPIWAMLLFSNRIAFSDPTVIASAARWVAVVGVLLPLFLSGSILGGFCVMGYTLKQPILGRKNTIYGAAGGYAEVYPLLGKKSRRPKPLTIPQKRERYMAAGMITAAIAISLLGSVMAVFARSDLHHDLSISVHNSFNAETQRYELEDVETVTLCIDRYRSTRTSFVYRNSLEVSFRMKNGRHFTFNADADTLLYVKSRVPASMLAYDLEISVRNYIAEEKCDKETAEKIREIFEGS